MALAILCISALHSQELPKGVQEPVEVLTGMRAVVSRLHMYEEGSSEVLPGLEVRQAREKGAAIVEGDSRRGDEAVMDTNSWRRHRTATETWEMQELPAKRNLHRAEQDHCSVAAVP